MIFIPIIANYVIDSVRVLLTQSLKNPETRTDSQFSDEEQRHPELPKIFLLSVAESELEPSN